MEERALIVVHKSYGYVRGYAEVATFLLSGYPLPGTSRGGWELAARCVARVLLSTSARRCCQGVGVG
jgi:hypothetical protein